MKERLDVLLVQQGFFESREKAKRVIMSGVVFVDGQRVDKAGTQVSDEAEIVVKGAVCPYVSRGGMKLAKAVKEFDIKLEGLSCMDMGASTGGFTDCMLQNGAVKVYAVDVGYGQLDWKLRNDERVVNMEKTNIRYMDVEAIEDVIDFISIDVSFISLTLILPVAEKLLKDGGKLVCLVKPQFEAGREQVGKKGIIKDKSVHREVILKVADFSKELGFSVDGVTFSPMTGAKGNIEYLLYMSKGSVTSLTEEDVERSTDRVIDEAHGLLMK
ncbi:MAG: TlyA family RNA methyltransferase [Firmicutes bacterium]|nr:TlyA family RNA methyltransferase [Bacillota bacterium]